MRTRHAAAALAALLVLAGCGSSGGGHLGAAEPATAPAGGPQPAGTVRSVGAQPEGIVYDPRTKLVAVAVHDPDRLLLLDPATLEVVHSVPLPGSVRHLQLAAPGGPVLVPVETAAKLVQVDLPAGTIRSTTQVGKQPHDAAGAPGGLVVVGNEFGRSISIVRNGTVFSTLPVVQQPGGVIDDGNTVALIDVAKFTLGTVGLRNRKQLAKVNAGKGPTHGALVSGNRLLVTDTRGNAVLLFDVDGLMRVGSLPLDGAPYGVAVDRSTDTVWVTLTARNQLVGLDVHGNTPKEIARYPTVRQPNTVAVAPGSHRLWVTGTDAGVVQRIER